MIDEHKSTNIIEKLIQQTSFKDNFEKALINIFYTANYFRDIHYEVFKDYKIQSQHFNVLRILKGQHPDSVSPGYLKEVMLDKGRDITRLVDKLESLGWVKRANCDKNKRKVHINLTRTGYKNVEELTKKLSDINQSLQKLSDKEYEILNSLIDKMR